MGDRAQRAARMLAPPAAITAMMLKVRLAALAPSPLCNALANIREQRLQTNRDVALHTRVNVPVRVGREFDRAVSSSFTRNLKRDAKEAHERVCRVPHVVHAEVRGEAMRRVPVGARIFLGDRGGLGEQRLPPAVALGCRREWASSSPS